MANSTEIKQLIVAKIQEEWKDPTLGADWKSGITEDIFLELAKPKNWKRVWKGRGLDGKGTKEDLMMRQFMFGGEEAELIISATVTCDKDDENVLDIEIEQQ